MVLPDPAAQAERAEDCEDVPQLSRPEGPSAGSNLSLMGNVGTELATAIVESHDDEEAGVAVGDSATAGNIDAENDSDQDGSQDSSIKDFSSVAGSDYLSISEASDNSGLMGKAARSLSSRALFEVYKKRLRRNRKLRRGQTVRFQQPVPGKTGSKGPMRTMPHEFVVDSGEAQASALVRGVVDYLRVLESRIKRVESGKIKPNALPMGPRGPPKTAKLQGDVELTVKFFDANAYRDLMPTRGEFPEVHPGTPNSAVPTAAQPGHFLCAEDTQQIVRVLFRSVAVAPSEGNDISSPLTALTEAPNPDDIEIIALGITSSYFEDFSIRHRSSAGFGRLKLGTPFRPLIRLHARLRSHLDKLERMYGGNGSSSPSESAVEVQSKANQRNSNSLPANEPKFLHFHAEALPHFRVIMEFIDKYFAKQILLLSRLKSGEEHEVAFQDLWCLFDAGTIVYRPPTESLRGGVDVVSDDSPPAVFRATSQAYRVVSTSGGVPMLSHVMDGRSPRARSGLVDHPETEESHSTNPRKIRAAYTEFYVYCASVDFDGTAYGVIRQIFVFKPFEGRVEVKSLQAYPVSASPDLYPSLLARGRAFIAATNVSHMQYEGLTSGTVREEINSPVVVDMTLAFQSDGDPGKKLIHIPEFSRGMAQWIWSNGLEMFDIFSSSSNSACSHPWCFALRHCHNPYESIQRANRETVESVIRAVLDDFEDPEANKVGSGNLCRLLETQDLLALLPGAVPGFALRSRKWVLLDLDLLKPVQQNNEWGNLVLPPGHREMVQAMVETHTKGLGPRKEIAGMDLVSGKGKGCIILLHGVPGVGKTSTAECVAAHTKKPLYPITCGDIGYSPEEVEKNMEGHFRLAHRWGCVLLLDEADVFLAKRDQRDIQRNGLVSVFLRILEYYSGILFLTTNRVGAIDDAFRSRLHLTLYYPKLDREQTLSIFRRNFRRVGEINVDRERNGLVPFEYKAARKRVIPWVKDNWESLAWNGRQIRNTFQTVMALAEFHANNKGDGALPALSRKHFQIVAHASDQFNKYLKATHGFDEDRVAKRDFVRAMEYTPDSSFVYRGRDKDVTDSSSEETESDSADEPSSDQDNDSEETDATKRKKSKKGKKKQKSDDKKSKKGKGKEKKTKEKKKERSEESEDTE